MKYTIALLALLSLIACPGPLTPKPTPVPIDTDWCGDAEASLEALQCRDRAGDPMWVNKNGERFEQTCETAQREGLIFLNPQCVAKAASCEEAKKCPAA